MAKYTCKLILWEHDTNAQKQHPVYLKITINRQTKYIATGYHVHKTTWDAKSEQLKPSVPNAELVNADLSDRKHRVIKYIVEANMRDQVLTAAQVKDAFAQGRNLHNYFDFVESYIAENRNKRSAGTLENYRKHAAKLELFHGSRQLFFEQIDAAFLNRYEAYLSGQGIGTNYIHALMKTMRTMFNAARRKELIQAYPFGKYEMVRYEAPDKDYLTLKELDALEKYADTVKDPVMRQTALYFLLGCYSGLRVSDWQKFSVPKHVRDGRLYLRATKNGEWVTMPVLGRLKRHLPKIKKVPLEIKEPTMNEKLKLIAKALKIPKKLTTHCGRHTFAITMCSEQGIGAETCAALMGITVSTCIENYYRVTPHKIYKEAADSWAEL